jgi:hypothetical protein
MTPPFPINQNGPASKAFLKLGLTNFTQACQYIANLKYKRISDKSNPLLVLQEQCGTCSSKHALLKMLAEENGQEQIKLKISIYKMTNQDTPKLKGVIPENLEFVPEAHSYLLFQGKKLDFTRANATHLKDEQILQEYEVSSKKMLDQKDKIHQEFIKDFGLKHNLDPEEIWQIRERCIEKLSE